jgi:hypothetical protein
MGQAVQCVAISVKNFCGIMERNKVFIHMVNCTVSIQMQLIFENQYVRHKSRGLGHGPRLQAS